MLNKIQALVLALLMLALGCSGGSSGFRTYGEDTSADPNGSSVADTSNRPRDEGVSPDDYTTGAIPNPLTGSNLVEVLVSATCVKLSDSPCKEVRLTAKVKVNDAKPVRFAADTVVPLGVKNSFWDIPAVPGVTCLATGAGFAFHPKCTSSDSLQHTIIKGTLTLVAADDSIFKGDAPDSVPTLSGGIFGNFMRLDATTGLTPSQTQYAQASANFSEVWAVLKGNEPHLDSLKDVSFVTNILYDGGNVPQTDWGLSRALCIGVNSGDGTGKWRLPTILELCGANFGANASGGSSDPCDGGLFKHRIKDVVFQGGIWTMYNFWSSDSYSANSGGSRWNMNFDTEKAGFSTPTFSNSGVICVR